MVAFTLQKRAIHRYYCHYWTVSEGRSEKTVRSANTLSAAGILPSALRHLRDSNRISEKPWIPVNMSGSQTSTPIQSQRLKQDLSMASRRLKGRKVMITSLTWNLYLKTLNTHTYAYTRTCTRAHIKQKSTSRYRLRWYIILHRYRNSAQEGRICRENEHGNEKQSDGKEKVGKWKKRRRDGRQGAEKASAKTRIAKPRTKPQICLRLLTVWPCAHTTPPRCDLPSFVAWISNLVVE